MAGREDSFSVVTSSVGERETAPRMENVGLISNYFNYTGKLSLNIEFKFNNNY